jgi:hypothetical protein
VTGQLYQALATSYPGARRVCFGDGMGIVFERRVHLSYLGRANDGLRQRVLRTGYELLGRARSLAAGRKHRLRLDDHDAHEAVLVLPVDQSGRFLTRMPLTVCPRATVVELVERCAAACVDLRDYIRELLSRHADRKRYLLLTENNAEGGFIDFQREIEMYCTVIEASCEPGAVVFLKSHPGESLPRNEELRKRLGTKFEVVELDRRFRRYPIEIWRELVLASTVVCMSYPVLSLKYLYDVDVIQPMDDAFVERWYPEWTWASYKNAVSLYMLPLRALTSWSGKGVLWAPQSGIGSR